MSKIHTDVRILIVICGGIAAFKSLLLIRLLRKRGFLVRCVMTRSAEQFITPLSVASLSGDKVYSSLFSLTDESEMGHIELSRQADLILVVPATANMIAKMAHGIADDLASTILMATDTPVMIVPSMNVRMWEHPATQRNVQQLWADGIHVLGPVQGDMACGEYGYGRMMEPDSIAIIVERQLSSQAKIVLLVGSIPRNVNGTRSYKEWDPNLFDETWSILCALGVDIEIWGGVDVQLSIPYRKIREETELIECLQEGRIAFSLAAFYGSIPTGLIDLTGSFNKEEEIQRVLAEP